MILGCIGNQAVIGTDKVGGNGTQSDCGLRGTFNTLNAVTPRAPQAHDTTVIVNAPIRSM